MSNSTQTADLFHNLSKHCPSHFVAKSMEIAYEKF